jgi:lipopolysaccharide biosynthesis protein
MRIVLHGHFYHAELAADFFVRLRSNLSRCDLFLSTNSHEKVELVREAAEGYDRGEVVIRVVPNRGRDIGPLLTLFADDIVKRYDIIGHVHGKRTTHTAPHGDPWREFLLQNLIGGMYPMMDIIISRFLADGRLGLVFPNDPHLCDWGENSSIGMNLATRIGINGRLPPFFEFPVGTMFWARAEALQPLFDLKLDWQDYPEEPAPTDGTLLHALERLLPFAAQHAGYRCAATYVPNVMR